MLRRQDNTICQCNGQHKVFVNSHIYKSIVIRYKPEDLACPRSYEASLRQKTSNVKISAYDSCLLLTFSLISQWANKSSGQGIDEMIYRYIKYICIYDIRHIRLCPCKLYKCSYSSFPSLSFQSLRSPITRPLTICGALAVQHWDLVYSVTSSHLQLSYSWLGGGSEWSTERQSSIHPP